MRLNVYAEEMTDRIEIIEKTTPDGKFTGLRIYLELPVTMLRCRQCGNLTGAGANMGLGCECPCPAGMREPFHIAGPFMHHEGDDDSSAVTFWGKRDLREALKKALAALDEHYGKAP